MAQATQAKATQAKATQAEATQAEPTVASSQAELALARAAEAQALNVQAAANANNSQQATAVTGLVRGRKVSNGTGIPVANLSASQQQALARACYKANCAMPSHVLAVYSKVRFVAIAPNGEKATLTRNI